MWKEKERIHSDRVLRWLSNAIQHWSLFLPWGPSSRPGVVKTTPSTSLTRLRCLIRKCRVHRVWPIDIWSYLIIFGNCYIALAMRKAFKVWGWLRMVIESSLHRWTRPWIWNCGRRKWARHSSTKPSFGALELDGGGHGEPWWTPLCLANVWLILRVVKGSKTWYIKSCRIQLCQTGAAFSRSKVWLLLWHHSQQLSGALQRPLDPEHPIPHWRGGVPRTHGADVGGLRVEKFMAMGYNMGYGYGSIPINTIFRGMNIHLPAILMFTRGTRFWHTAI